MSLERAIHLPYSPRSQRWKLLTFERDQGKEKNIGKGKTTFQW